jgi:hypothetical protein
MPHARTLAFMLLVTARAFTRFRSSSKRSDEENPPIQEADWIKR